MIGAERQSRVAIVTGGSRGLGRAIATRVASDGFAVIVNYRREEEAAAATVGSIIAAGGRAAEVQGDVARPDDVKALFDRAEAMFGGVDVVVNCAGIMTVKPLADYDLSAFDAMVSTNVRGTFLVSQQAARRVRPGGAIINMASILGSVGFATAPAYTAAKHGVVGLTKAAAIEYSAHGVRINAVGPAFIHTPMISGLEQDAGINAMLVGAHPIGRLGQPEEVAELVTWLASGKASFVTGAYYPVDGGYLAR